MVGVAPYPPGFGFGLPATLAAFPTVGAIKVSQLEKRFRELPGIGPDTTVYFNKGL